MLIHPFRNIMYRCTFLILLCIDYFIGNGFVDILHRSICKLICFTRKSIREEEKLRSSHIEIEDTTVCLSVLVTEIMLLSLMIKFLNKYKQIRSKDRIDDLLQDSREAMRQTNEFINKWRLRHINMQSQNEYTYLDEDPQEIRPYEFEVPILHMAIIDTTGNARNQPESGDAGEMTSYTDSALFSVTSLLDEDFGSATEECPEEALAPEDSMSSRTRYLWDLQEEECNNFD